MASEVDFDQPLPAQKAARRRGKWDELIGDLKARPGAWARVIGNAGGDYDTMQRAKDAARALRGHGCETAVRKVEMRGRPDYEAGAAWGVWARWPEDGRPYVPRRGAKR